MNLIRCNIAILLMSIRMLMSCGIILLLEDDCELHILYVTVTAIVTTCAIDLQL